jgi:hypothetical protein
VAKISVLELKLANGMPVWGQIVDRESGISFGTGKLQVRFSRNLLMKGFMKNC